MAAYWTARAKFNDPTKYKKNTDQVPGIIARVGGKVLARGDRFGLVEGFEHFERRMIIKSPSYKLALACHHSTQYRAARRIG